jgi:hypothetical protein
VTIVAGTLACLFVFLLALLPPGYLLLRLCRVSASGLAGIGIATAVGYSAVLPLFLAERALDLPFLVPLASLACLVALRPGRGALRALIHLLPDLAAPLGLAVLALVVNGGDLVSTQGGLSFRVGFDVSDRAFYGTLSQELLRAPLGRIENPLFAPLPLQYAYFPAVAGALLQFYTGIPALVIWMFHLPAIALAFTGLATAALLAALGVPDRLVRLSAMLLVVLGGDLSYLVNGDTLWLRRASHFFAFHAFSAESLYYNPWMFGVPIAFAGIALAAVYLREGGSGRLLLAALVIGGLFETKVFAFLPLTLGALTLGALFRKPRLLALGAAASVAAAPWALLTLAAEAGRGAFPLSLAPFHVVYASADANPALRDLGTAVGVGATTPLLRVPGLVLVVIVFLVGGFGVRLLGLPLLVRRARADPGGADTLIAGSLLWMVGLSLLLVGNPTPLDGAQFLMCAQFLAWPYAGIALGRLARAGGARRGLALALFALALLSPLRYVALKLFPESLTPAGSVDRARYVVSPDALAACRFLAQTSPATDRLVVPLHPPGDEGGLGALYFGALAGRRVSAVAADVHVVPAVGAERRAAVLRLFTTTDAPEGEALLNRLGAAWVWEDASEPLRFQSSRLEPLFARGAVRLLRLRPPPG